MRNNFYERLKDRKLAYAILLMGIGILLHFAIEEFNFFDKELLGFLTGLFVGAGVVITLSVLLGKRKVKERIES